jgi:hypothetical protein
VMFWSAFGACVADVPDDPPPPAARLVTSWDPLACGSPHRVVVELASDEGLEVSSSAPCANGGLTLDAPRWGIYTGRIYTWVQGEPIRSVRHVTLAVDAPIVHWQVITPP